MSFLKKIFSGKAKENKTSDYVVGDIFYTHNNGKYNLYKLLVRDEDFECYHVLSYSALGSLPSIADIDNLTVFAYHAPIAKSGFGNTTLLVNKPVKADDLIGYHEYLRQTRETKDYAGIASDYYNSALRLTNEKEYSEAIDSYSKAIDLYPGFFEAIDNRAFCKMDLGLWEEAIIDFQLSLEQNKNSVLAEFSIGECYFNMGQYQKAKEQFEIAHKIDPEHEAPKIFLEKVKEALNK